MEEPVYGLISATAIGSTPHLVLYCVRRDVDVEQPHERSLIRIRQTVQEHGELTNCRIGANVPSAGDGTKEYMA
jgi:hypothetical protein